MPRFTGFEIAKRDGDYLILFNTTDGATLELIASYEQMDLIAEEIDRQLDQDEDGAFVLDAGAE